MRTNGQHPRVYLTEPMTETESGVLHTWLGEQVSGSATPATAVTISDRALAELTARDDDPLLTPVRVVWLPRDPDEPGAQRLREALSPRDPLHPGRGAQRRMLRTDPDRCRVIEGEPAPLSDLERRLTEDGGGSLPEFIRRQAALALERAERTLLGDQYKVSRFVVDEITDSRRYRDGTRQLAADLRVPLGEVDGRAREALDELVATQSRRAIAVWDRLGRYFSRAYRLDVDTARFDELRELNRQHSLVFLPSHRSYLDPLVLRPALLANDLPLNHVMGGLNINFWPIGPIGKRSGTVFIRRKFGDDDVYKWTLREYMRYLVTKRFNLEWYIEGGRTRTGKLRPPRFGLLTYLAQAFRTSVASDVYLVPVALTYDQLYEVKAMAAEAHGEVKQKEGFRWMVGYVRAQGNRRGVAHVTIGRPLSLARSLAQEPDQRLAIQKTAFEVCHRINEVTPVTASSLLLLAFLGIEDRALTVPELDFILDPLIDYIRARRLPTAGDFDLTNPLVFRTALQTHLDSGVLRRFDKGDERVYFLGSDQHLVAAFYRNNSIHFLVVRAIAELVLQAAVEERFTDPIRDGWTEAKRIRDLLKFEFFFPDKDTFERQLRDELDLIRPTWEDELTNPHYAENILGAVRPYLAHRVLQPFLEAYAVVADQLVLAPASPALDEPAFVEQCLAIAKQRRLRQQIASSESISGELFGTALALARNRGLVEATGADTAHRRAQFAAEIGVLVRRVQRIRELAHARLDSLSEPVPAPVPGPDTDGGAPEPDGSAS
ncbi:glycerol-3-phosphate 1-O-acyltransferase [Rhodococcus sp. NPDC058505]|uniref:glycerol-3-phosphate 1-O-acyltransferase n=1 Tax=unclassified Rhodococcus (in: high G+C Gram-positive bacteria) TaxID=192944 RepID=UPI00364E3618